MDYFHSKQKFTPEKGDLLISEPYLPDPNFERTVVLICEHDENGTFGYVLNKPSTAVFEDVVEQVSDFKEKLYIGGPVQQDTLHFIHRSPKSMPTSKEIGPGLFWGGDYEKLLSLIDLNQIKTSDFKFFLGYSGWSEGQLEVELEAKSWIVHKNSDPSIIFDIPEDELWKIVLEKLGGKFKMFSNYPTDPNMN